MIVAASIVSVALVIVTILVLNSDVVTSRHAQTEYYEEDDRPGKKWIRMNHANEEAIHYAKIISDAVREPGTTVVFDTHHILIIEDGVATKYRLFPFSEERMGQTSEKPRKTRRAAYRNNGYHLEEPDYLVDAFHNN